MPLHVPGVGEHLAGRSLAHDASFVHQQDPVGGQDVFGLVLDQDDALDFMAEDLRKPEDVSLAHGVQVGRRLVHDDERGAAREYRRDGQALFFAARQAGGIPLLEAREADAVQRLFDTGSHLTPVHGKVLEGEGRFEFDVGGKQLRLEVLEYQADDAGQFVDVRMAGCPIAGDLQAALQPALRKGGNEPVEAAAQGGFARAGLADDYGKFTAAMTVIDLVERRFRGVPIGEGQVVERKDRLIQGTCCIDAQRRFITFGWMAVYRVREHVSG